MDWRQEEALWRYSLIREASDTRLSCGRARSVGAFVGGPVACASVGRVALGRALDG